MGSETSKALVCKFTRGFQSQTVRPPCIWFPKGSLLVLDDLFAEGSEYTELLVLYTKHSLHKNITVLYFCQDMFPPGKYAKSIVRDTDYIVAFQNPRDKLAMKDHVITSSFSHLLARHDGRVSKSDRTTVWVHGPAFTSRQ